MRLGAAASCTTPLRAAPACPRPRQPSSSILAPGAGLQPEQVDPLFLLRPAPDSVPSSGFGRSPSFWTGRPPGCRGSRRPRTTLHRRPSGRSTLPRLPLLRRRRLAGARARWGDRHLRRRPGDRRRRPCRSRRAARRLAGGGAVACCRSGRTGRRSLVKRHSRASATGAPVATGVPGQANRQPIR